MMNPIVFTRRIALLLLIAFGLAAEAGSNIVVPSPRGRPAGLVVAAQDRATEAAVPGPCLNCRPPKTVPVLAPTVLSFRTKGKPLGPTCKSQFINPKGQIGPVGRQIAGLIKSEPYKSKFLNGRSLRAVCPRFSKLNEEQQTQAWVWFWMVLANEESTCNVSLAHKTHYPDGRILNPKPGYGLFAAERYPQHRNWRGRMCQGDITSSTTQVNCAVHTMAATQFSRGRGLLWKGSYWGPVRRAGRQIMPNMRGFKSCF